MLTCIYLPNRDELSFRVVLALPNASRIGFVARICRSISLESSRENLGFVFVSASGGFTDARYRMMNFAYPDVSYGGTKMGLYSRILSFQHH